ncbi:Doubled CXXCH motif (Paired_CXXCH_1) [Symmachiella dynata]|nr:Doubled CXXCH motif (Paired_CXXCH_1) [Symmachiella dynata]
MQFRYRVIAVCMLVVVSTVVTTAYFRSVRTPRTQNNQRPEDRVKPPQVTNYFDKRAVFLWGNPPAVASAKSQVQTPASNIRRSDYVGPDACQSCHKEQHDNWSEHSHRWMNAYATEETVLGDFSGASKTNYMGGDASFFRTNGEFHARLSRNDVVREFRIERTIGRRFYQSYVGRLIDGPDPKNDPLWQLDVHIPFTYWIQQKEWVPETHLSEETPDEQRVDPFESKTLRVYSTGCASCHTTRPIGDWLWSYKSWKRAEIYTPHSFAFDTRGYFSEAHPKLAALIPDGRMPSKKAAASLRYKLESLPAPEFAVTLGISCEACHNGCRDHVAQPKEHRPSFFPASPHLTVLEDQPSHDIWGRTQENINFICARCHSAQNVTYAGGMACFNSQEATDAMNGHCYRGSTNADVAHNEMGNALSCVHCHDPHQAIGQKWARTPDEDDASCLQCHQQFVEPDARSMHTHHSAGSAGSRCMNCHMPKISEGLQDVVRTHMIFSPTNRKMIEANQPNACNLCHVEENIDWTIHNLRKWYGEEHTDYSEQMLSQNYPDRNRAVALGWLRNSSSEATRLIGVDALTKANAQWALTDLINALDDPYLINRQFAQQGLETMLDIDLDTLNYKYYQLGRESRKASLDRIRRSLLPQTVK